MNSRLSLNKRFGFYPLGLCVKLYTSVIEFPWVNYGL